MAKFPIPKDDNSSCYHSRAVYHFKDHIRAMDDAKWLLVLHRALLIIVWMCVVFEQGGVNLGLVMLSVILGVVYSVAGLVYCGVWGEEGFNQRFSFGVSRAVVQLATVCVAETVLFWGALWWAYPAIGVLCVGSLALGVPVLMITRYHHNEAHGKQTSVITMKAAFEDL